MPAILLVDNGSRRAASTLNLRQLAAQLGQSLGERIEPLSLLHSDAAPLDELGGQPAELLEAGLRARLAAGVRHFVLLPLFFGPSRALTDFIPGLARQLAETHGPFRLDLAPPLCPLPRGEPRLIDILRQNLRQADGGRDPRALRVVLVDHGSPLPEVSAVRHWLAKGLAEQLGPEVELHEAVMERREGARYDFNGILLEDRLHQLAAADAHRPILLSMLFLSPGRHAGPGGDIADICTRVRAAHPDLNIAMAPLVGSHPLLLEILASRLRETLDHAPLLSA